jgi:hypothetical protein
VSDKYDPQTGIFRRPLPPEFWDALKDLASQQNEVLAMLPMLPCAVPVRPAGDAPRTDLPKAQWRDYRTGEIVESPMCDDDWMPIDTAPKDGRRILCWVPLSESVDILWWHGDHWEDDQLNHAEPTHWKYLPARPCEEQLTMSDMVERVRSAMRATGYVDEWDDYPLTLVARSVIEAMRDPAPAILEAHHVVPDDTDFRERALANWQAMIDAACAEEKAV